jgi:nucleotide-binding universal stress UspA family protein
MTTKRIVVGVDESPGARAALEWAVDESGLRGCTLLVVHALGVRHADPLEGEPAIRGYDDFAEQLLTGLVAAASARRPGVPVTTLLSHGQPADTLIDLSCDAELVVVGTRGNNGFTTTMLGSVSLDTAVHALCPVAVVPRQAPRPAVGDAAPDVVLGSAPGRAGRPALKFARAEARMRAAALRSVQFDDQPAESLLRAAQGAQLLVIGYSDDRWGSRLGPVSTSVLHRSPCPVVVVGAPQRTPADPVAGIASQVPARL